MAQLSPIPTPNVFKPPIPPSPTLLTHNPIFYPRKEFIRDQRVVSSFSLLTLAGNGAVRLYSFPNSVINALRRFFDTHKLSYGCRENPTTHLFEFSLDQKPWANIKTLMSEKLIVSIFSIIFQYGYSFLSTVEYGREHDDRVAIAFSRPTIAPNSSAIPIMPNISTSTLPHAGPMIFAISFPTPRVLRVIEPPLPFTPAILQAVRNTWPRGIADEKRLGDTYEFKLNGYKWFQENTFAIDSLQQILSLLSALDKHSFSLLTSLTVGSRSRTRDFWIFTGPPADNSSAESPPASPTRSSIELKHNGVAHLGGSHSGSLRPSSETQTQSSQARSSSPFASSPLRQVTLSTGGKLKKPFPKVELPQAFKSEASLNEMGHLPSDVGSVDMTGVGTAHRRAASQPHTPDVFYTTSPHHPPGTIYQQEFNPWNRSMAPGPTTPPIAAHFPTVPIAPQQSRQSRHHSLTQHDDPLFRGSLGDSPYDAARPRTGSLGSIPAGPPLVRVRRASTPLAPTPPLSAFQPSQAPLSRSATLDVAQADAGLPRLETHDSITKSDRARDASDVPRIPTPPLLGPGAFRDSAFSASTGWRSTEIPIAWTGKDPELLDEKRKTVASGVPDTADPQPPISQSPPRVLHGPRERRQSGGPRTDVQSPSRPPSQSPPATGPVASTAPAIAAAQEPQTASAGPVLPGAWASTPQEEKRQDDVVPIGTPSLSTTTTATTTMFPPTIKEQPSQEGDEARVERKGQVRVHSPEEHRAEGEGARRSEAAWVGNTMDRNEKTPPNGTMPTKPHTQAVQPLAKLPTATPNGIAHSSSRPQRASSISEGWVLVNIDGRSKGASARSPVQGPTRPAPHTRSSSDSRLPAAHTLAQTTAGAGKATMSPAAKAIVVVDAVGVKEAERQKAAQGSRFKRLLGRGKERSGSPTPTPERGSPAPSSPQLQQQRVAGRGDYGQTNGIPPTKSRSTTLQSQQQLSQPSNPAARVRR
ncbi:hypothetical protein GY45DRAFT_1333776 [Cubamyces sp. BRFM 1775]|nr:hypothetical protein GY45DRAFT_1333776 [Cubamyces sp. BRFM 1775]